MKKSLSILYFLSSILLALLAAAFLAHAVTSVPGAEHSFGLIFTMLLIGSLLMLLGVKKEAGILAVDMSMVGRRMTPAQKQIAVNRQYGNRNAKDQQSTSRVIYHALPLDGRTQFDFFKNVGSGTGLAGEVGLPFNNISENKLQVGESLTIRRLYFCVLLFDEMSGVFTGVTDLTTAGVPEIYGGDYETKFDTMTVAKPNPLSSQLPVFSKNSNHTTNEWIWLDNDAVIIQDIQFQVSLQVPVYTPVANARIRLVMEGFGALLSPKGQF